MKEHPQKFKIRAAIMRYFTRLKIGDEYQSENLCNYVRGEIRKKKPWPSTINRYARELREHGKINYTAIHKETRRMRVIEMGEAHSL